MKIVYFGSDVFIDVFRYLLAHHEILALYTYHNAEDYFNAFRIVQLAHLHDIPVHYTLISAQDMRDYIEQRGCELFFVAEYSHKLPVVEHPAFRGINIHSSLLPQGRSYYPIEGALARGYTESGVTIHKLASRLDCGDIVMQRRYVIDPLDDSVDLYLKAGQLAREMAETLMPDFERYWQKAIPQTVVLPYWNRPELLNMTLRHEMTVTEAWACYHRFNKMTEVRIDGQRFHVDGFVAGHAMIGIRDADVIFVRETRVLFGVTDGHLRLDIAATDA